MKIALLWPESTFLIDPMVYPPLGLWYLWTMLENAGHIVEYYDASDPSIDILQVKWHKYNQVWISGTTPQLSRIRYWTNRITDAGVKVVVGGPHMTAHGDDFTKEFPNVLVVRGEVSVSDISVIVDMGGMGHGGVIDTFQQPDLSNFPLPQRKIGAKYTAYLDGNFCTTMITSIGCPYKCAFCSSNFLYGSKVRYFPMDNVLVDIFRISRLGYGAIQFYDDILPIRKQRTLTIAHELDRLDLIWRCFMRSDLGLLNGKDFLVELADCGLREVLVGVESASNVIKNAIHKGTTVEQDTLFREWCRDAGISYKASIILGLPGETMETMQATRKWILDNRPDRVDINTLIPMPGTPLYDNPAEYGCKFSVGQDIDTYFYKGRLSEVRCVVETDELTSEQISQFRLDLIHEGIPY